MSTKHVKLKKPTNADIHRNPLIGGSKGVTMAQVTSDELEEFVGVNTMEGDIENDTNPQGGIDKAEVRDRRRGPPLADRDSGPRRPQLQGKKTHEQQLRILERKPDVPDARQVEEDIARTQRDGGAKTVKRGGRQSEFAVSRGGLNQESQHNKHNNPGQSGHKPQKQQG
ncbi:hypothetical protein [Bradyrhizobium valentinum]|uniref:hypothetical protein n=1 Tax=Bradyrhizobium valentinum TaxID=1518501 RepID=UPI001FDAC6A4|nr:hypothetical protein [Bradyrhizobium valentinum]